MNLVKAIQPDKYSRLCRLYPGMATLWRQPYGHAKVTCQKRRMLRKWSENAMPGHFGFNGVAGAMPTLFASRLQREIQIAIAQCYIQHLSPSPAVSSLGAYTTPAP
jgi:hypothetical protein